MTPPATRPKSTDGEPGERLQKVLARAGLGSRRACEELIGQGRVSVNGKQIREQGRRVDAQADRIAVDGSVVITRTDLAYLAMNKPVGMLTAMTDDRGRPTVGDMVRERTESGIVHVGRLDIETEGLLLLTNDGQLGHRLAHPSYEVPKTYRAQVPGPLPRDLGKRLKSGVALEDGPAKVDDFTVIDVAAGQAMIEVVLHEGRNRIVRRMLAEVGHPVSRLVRTQVGPVRLGRTRPGAVRNLSPREIADLFKVVDL